MHWYPAAEFPQAICNLFRPWWNEQSFPFASVSRPCKQTVNHDEIMLRKLLIKFHRGVPTYFYVPKHFLEVVTSTTQRQVIKNVLIHQLDVRVTKLDCSIVISEVKVKNHQKTETFANNDLETVFFQLSSVTF